jgi:hypothetical protein
MIFTKEEFKTKWNSENGGGITFDDIADCAKDWGLFRTPKTASMMKVANAVLVLAGCEKYFEDEDNDEDAS